MVGVVGLCALGATSGMWPGVDAVSTLVVAGLGGVVVVAAAVVAVRRELRIRGRLAAIQPLRSTDAVSLAHTERVAS